MLEDVMGRRSPMERAMAGRVQPFRQLAAESVPVGERLDLTNPGGFTPPAENVRRAVVEALEAGETRYTARTGIEPLRQAIADRSTAEGFPATPETCVVTNGGSEGLFIALQTLVFAGDRVVLVEPVAPHLAALVEFIGGQVESMLELPLAGLEEAGVVVLATASAIDGTAVPDDLLTGLLEEAANHGVTVILDRSAEPDRYEAAQPLSRTDLAEQVVTIGSMSGAFGLDGWRAGYFTAPKELMGRLAGLKESMSISTTTPAQFAMLETLRDADAVLEQAREQARARRDMVSEILQSQGVTFRVPEVYPGLLIDVRQTGLSDGEVAHRLETEHSVRVEAGSALGSSLDGHIRIDLGTPEETLREGVERLARFLVGEAR